MYISVSIMVVKHTVNKKCNKFSIHTLNVMNYSDLAPTPILMPTPPLKVSVSVKLVSWDPFLKSTDLRQIYPVENRRQHKTLNVFLGRILFLMLRDMAVMSLMMADYVIGLQSVFLVWCLYQGSAVNTASHTLLLSVPLLRMDRLCYPLRLPQAHDGGRGAACSGSHSGSSTSCCQPTGDGPGCRGQLNQHRPEVSPSSLGPSLQSSVGILKQHFCTIPVK